ncbi:MAG: 3-hydroxyacyl-CoA dehydrogenase NAD-binding domain-containing protein [Pseudomonadota bacterium]
MNDVVRLEWPSLQIGLIRVANPPVNAISHAVRLGLVAAVEEAAKRAEAQMLVLACDGRTFMAGADIREFGKPWEPPGLPEVVDALEASRLPIVAAIHGNALGGGLEVALGCHFRVAVAGARLGFPEVNLGLIPGAQGTQRAPRLMGVSDALGMIVTGKPIRAERAVELGLLDAVVPLEAGEDGPVAAAIAFAAAHSDQPPRRLSEVAVPALDQAPAVLDAARERLEREAPGQTAPAFAVQAVATLLEHGTGGTRAAFDEGVAVERDLFQQALASPQSAALRHVFFGEREVARVPGVDRETSVREIRQAAVIGGGTMGTGIAICLLDAGVEVCMVERDWAPLTKAFDAIQAHYERAVTKGRIPEAVAEQRTRQLRGERDLAALGDVDLVIEAVFEDMSLKQDIFRRLDGICRDGAILATNTSTLDVDEIAAVTSRPSDVLGLHFFSPANAMRLLEIVRGAKTDNEVLATALKLGKRLRKVSVVSGVCRGFIGNRMVDPYLREMNQLLLEGASPSQIDAAMETFGCALGPCKVSDLAGIDVGYRIHQHLPERPADPGFFVLEGALVSRERLGQKSGAGFYRYEPEAPYRALPDPQVDALIAQTAGDLGITRRSIDAEEIVERCLLALINEGARVLDDGIALRSVDIDIIYVNGYGFPAWRGGPMFHGDTLGAKHVSARLRALGERLGNEHGYYDVAPLVQRLADTGESFQSVKAPGLK